MRIKFLLFLIFITQNLFGDDFNGLIHPEKGFSIFAGINYVTSSRVYLMSRSPDPDLRNAYYSTDGFIGYTFELKGNLINNSIQIGLITEYLKTSQFFYSTRAIVNNLVRTLEVEDTYQLYPLELIIYYIFPFSRDWYKAYMGAGAGIYYADYSRQIFDIKSKSTVSKIDYGIVVNTGVKFQIFKNLDLRLEMKFRDPELEFKNEYPKTETNINGERILLFEKTFYTKVNIDGINILLGLNYNF